MGKVVKTIGKIAGVIAGIAAIGTGIGAVLGGTMVLSVLGTTVAASAIAAGAGLVATVAGMVAGGPNIPQSATQLGRLQARLDTQAPRKLVLGSTAMPADVRYYEGSGEDEEYVDYIICVAAHRVRAINQIWFEDTLAWTATGGVQGEYVGYLTNVTTRLEGTATNTIAINGGTRWGSDDRLTGCAYLRLRIKRTGNSDDEQSPLVSGLPGRVTIIGEGMPMYDPRFDSTAGGDGPMRVDDQSTWGPSSENLIIQSLNVLLGWRINGKLSVGGGLPAKFIDMDSVITAANICDEDIALSAGGTQARYRGAGAFSTDDAPMAIVSALLAGCAGDLLDSEGKLSFLIKTNTLATPAVEFDDHDVLSPGTWDPMGGQTNLPNIIAGNFTDPSSNSLYQPVPYRSVSLPSEDGIDRTAPLDLGVVENAARAERLAKQTLQRMQYPGTFTAEYNMKAMAAKVGCIVWQTYSPRGWVNKPFRVIRQKPSRSGRIALVLREEHEDIYAWEAEDSAAVQAAEPVRFDPRNAGPILLARKAAETAQWDKITGDGKPDDNADVTGENTAADTDNVNGRPAEQVTDDLDQHGSDLAVHGAAIEAAQQSIIAVQGNIADLIITYGSTASAAASADVAASFAQLAGEHEANVLVAQQIVLDAKDAALAAEAGATDQAGIATQERLLVQTARAETEGFRNDAFLAKEGAEGAAATATTHSGISSASSAAAREAMAATFPRTMRFGAFATYTSSSMGSPTAMPEARFSSGIFTTAGGTATNSGIGTREVIELIPGRKTRITARLKVDDPNISTSHNLFLRRWDGTSDASTGLGAPPGFTANPTPAEYQTVEWVLDHSAILAWMPATRYVSPVLALNRGPGGVGTTTNVTRVSSFFPEDVTSEKASEASALASAESVTTVTSLVSEAEQHAEATDSDRLAAQAARGESEAIRNQVVSVKEDVEGLAASAASSEGVAVSTKELLDQRLADELPERLDEFGTGFYATNLDAGYTYPSLTPLFTGYAGAVARPEVEYVEGFGYVWRRIAGRFNIGHTTLTPMLPGRVYSFEFEGEVLPDEGSLNYTASLVALDESLALAGSAGFSETVSAGPVSAGPLYISREPNLPGVQHCPNGRLFRAFVRLNSTRTNFRGKVFRVRDVTEQFMAGQSASAAAISEANAAASEDAAGNHAATANQASGVAVQAKNDTLTTASAVDEVAAIATAAASAAEQKIEIAASMSFGALNPNPTFASWPDDASPVGWGNPTAGTITRQNGGKFGSPYALRFTSGLGDVAYVQVGGMENQQGGWLVIEADARKISGDWAGVALVVFAYAEGGGFLTSRSIDLSDPTNLVAETGNNRAFAAMAEFPATAARYVVRLYNNHTSFGNAAKTIDWYRASVRRATQAEIAEKVLLPALEAYVQENSGAIADMEGGAVAYLEQIVAATGSNPAMMQMLAGKDGSSIGLVADVIALGNKVDGVIAEVVRVENGQARLNNALIRGLQVAPTVDSSIFHEVMLKPLIFLGEDGDIIEYQDGGTYGAGNLPSRIEVDTSGLPALAQGESYDVRAINVTPTQFEVRAKKLLSAAGATQTSNAGAPAGDGSFVTNKPTAEDAYDGYYQFTVGAHIPRSDLQGGPGGGQFYEGQVTLQGKDVNGNWVHMGVMLLTGYDGSMMPPSTIYVTRTYSVQSAANLGSGPAHFRVVPTYAASIGDFTRVRYVTQASGGEQPLDRAIRFTVYPPSQS